MKNLSSAFLILLLLGIWEAIARVMDAPFILPSPVQVAVKVWELRHVLLVDHLPATLLIIVIALGISILFGVLIAVMMSQSQLAERAFYPVLIATQTIPIIAIAPIFVLWFGYTIWSKVIVAILFTFFPITVSTYDGFRTGSAGLKELLCTMNASRKEIFMKVQVPAAMPSFFSGLKVAVPMSVIGAAVGEWLGAQEGLGYFSRRMMTQFDGAGVFAPIVLLSVLGILMFLAVVLLEKYLLRWRRFE